MPRPTRLNLLELEDRATPTAALVAPPLPITEVVAVAAPTTTVANDVSIPFSLPHLVRVGPHVTLRAALTTAGGPVNQGTVTFTVLQGSTAIGAVTGNVLNGMASAPYRPPIGTPAGSYTIRAVFNATPALQSSSDATHRLTIAPPQPMTTLGNPTGWSQDPNDMLGPVGVGPGHAVPAGDAMDYTIRFENDGTGPAHDITVTAQLDPNLDPSTFRLGTVGFGDARMTVPDGTTQSVSVIHYQVPGGPAIAVPMSFDYDAKTGRLSVSLHSYNPETGEPLNWRDAGLLTTENGTNSNDGFITFSVKPKADLPAGTAIDQKASIVFDLNAAMDTPSVYNTVGLVAPTYFVGELPTILSVKVDDVIPNRTTPVSPRSDARADQSMPVAGGVPELAVARTDAPDSHGGRWFDDFAGVLVG